MRRVLVEGFGRMLRAPGLVALAYTTNLLFAAILAVPLASALEATLTASPDTTIDSGTFWADWERGREGWMKELSPEILGTGAFFGALERLLGGDLPGGVFRTVSELEATRTNGAILGLGLLYLLVQAFLLGGYLGTYRALRGTWTPNGFFHGSAFYFTRMVRAGVVGLLFAAMAFAIHAPLARMLRDAALGATSETTALVLGFASHSLLLLLLLFVSMVTSYARVIIVAEERKSALFAYLSALVFSCGRNFPVAFAHSLLMAGLVAALVLGWARFDGAVDPFLPAVLVLGQLLVVARIGIRLSTLAGRYALYSRALPSGGASKDRL